jgi:hypothetical protein
VSFLMVFFGTLFFAVASDYGLIAAVLAAPAPAMLGAINAYPSVAAPNGLLIVSFFYKALWSVAIVGALFLGLGLI